MTRRLFEDDIHCHFVGAVVATSETLTELRGHTFIFQQSTGGYARLPEERTRIFSLGEAGHIVNKIPKQVDVNAVVYKLVDSHLVITDGTFSLPVNEFGPIR
jgi:hypothetical protein